MGRRKISIQPITDERNRKVTFVKRKAGLLKKAHELAVLCQVDLAVIILGNNNSKFYEYTSVKIDDLLSQYKDDNYIHDLKVPADYGDYKLESRVVRGASRNKSHHRSTSSVSIAEDNINSSDDDDDDDEDDEDEDDEEEKAKPPSKKRRATQAKKEPKKTNPRLKNEGQPQPTPPQQEQVPVSLPHQHISHQHISQRQIPNQQIPNQQIPNQHVPNQQIPNQQIPNQQISNQPLIPHPPLDHQPLHNRLQQQHQNQSIFYSQNPGNVPFGGRPTPPQQLQIPSTYQIEQSNVIPPANPPRGTFTPQGSHIPINPYPPYPTLQFSPSTPVSSRSNISSDLPAIGTPPVVPKSKNGHGTPYSNARARTLNDSISSRPILRVETHLTQPPKPVPDVQGDSAMTLTAIDTSKNDTSKVESSGERTPSSGLKSADDNKPAGLGISSNKSTPLSATLPSGLFNLPPPQSSQHHQAQHQLASGSRTLMAGEQTPLTGGLPSRYVPDLFPSPSNFYSNDWNIPFGSGTTPYPNSAGPTNHTLPAINASNANGLTNAKSRLKDKLFNDSPLQKEAKQAKREHEYITKHIKFDTTKDYKKD